MKRLANCGRIFSAAFGAWLWFSSCVIASPGDLFVSDRESGSVYEFTPSGTRSTFASGLLGPLGLAFDHSGNLFVADFTANNIYEFTPSGTRSTFASGLNGPEGLALDRNGNLFVADSESNNIYEFNPRGQISQFAAGLNYPTDLTFAPTPTPEPSTLALLATGVLGLLGYGWPRRRTVRRAAQPDAQDDAPEILSFPSHSPPAHAARRAA